MIRRRHESFGSKPWTLHSTTAVDSRTRLTQPPESRNQRVAQCLIRLEDAEGLAILGEALYLQETPLPPSIATHDGGGAPIDIEVLWTVAEMVAGHIRLGNDEAGESLASAYGLVREERWPAFQARGWRSTRPEHARAGVL